MSARNHDHRRQIKATKPGAFHVRRPAGTKLLKAAWRNRIGCFSRPTAALGGLSEDQIRTRLRAMDDALRSTRRGRG